MHLVVTGGGTGGHVYPALSILAAWRDLAGPDATLLYVGTHGGMEEGIVANAGLPFRGIAAGPLRGRAPWEVAASLGRLAIGLGQSLAALREPRASAVLATGGYVCAPVVIAAWLLGIPSLIYLPDVEPGWAVRALSRLATRVAVTSARSRAFLPPGKVVETGYPVRSEFGKASREEARQRLGLDPGLPVLVVAGGSRGARSINETVRDALPELVRLVQVVHVAGPLEEPALRSAEQALPPDLRPRYRLYAYLHQEFPDALAAADLVVSRSGASVLGEYPMAGAPSVLVPYPYAGGHQEHNADALVAAGAAVKLRNADLSQLLPLLRDLLGDPARLAAMRAAARALAKPDAARQVAMLLCTMTGHECDARVE